MVATVCALRPCKSLSELLDELDVYARASRASECRTLESSSLGVLLWENSYNRERRAEVLLCRLISHSRLAHQYVLRGGNVSLCEYCGVLLTMLDIL